MLDTQCAELVEFRLDCKFLKTEIQIIFFKIRKNLIK